MPFATMSNGVPEGLATDDFTVGADRDDLEKMERWHTDGAGFSYTVMNPTETECLGCVYLRATDAPSYAGARVTPVGDRRWEDYEATVFFWVRESRLATATDRALLDALRAWLAKDWSLGAISSSPANCAPSRST